jgi:hypothetical protein
MKSGVLSLRSLRLRKEAISQSGVPNYGYQNRWGLTINFCDFAVFAYISSSPAKCYFEMCKGYLTPRHTQPNNICQLSTFYS